MGPDKQHPGPPASEQAGPMRTGTAAGTALAGYPPARALRVPVTGKSHLR